jgi:hypothetical protein
LQTVFAAIAFLALAAVTGRAQQAEPSFRPEASGIIHREQPPFAFKTSHPSSIVTLESPLSLSLSGNRVGIVRNLPAGVAGKTGVLTFRSSGASRVRLHLRAVKFGSPSLMWVAGQDGISATFGPELVSPDGGVWTPSVTGDIITIEAPDGSEFVADAIGHIAPVPESTTCYIGESCSNFPDKSSLSASIGQMIFVSGVDIVACTGGLISKNGDSPDNLFLTANHCISTQIQASSLEVSWDVVDSSCGAGDESSRVKLTNGATLLATSLSTDVTLLRLASLPGGRWLMGWTSTPPAAGTTLRRISHPSTDTGGVFQQVYSTTSVYSGPNTCAGASRPNFMYSTPLTGGAGPGSSGSPVIIDGGYIVGQLKGLCGQNPTDGCAAGNTLVDGSFASSYSLLQPFIDPSPITTCSSCAASSNTACLLGNRFQVTMSWHDFTANQSGSGTVIKYADNLPEISPQYGPVSEIAFFSMYPSAPKSIEVFVRMLQGVGINNKFWVFLSSLATAEYTVTVTDTKTCQVWARTIPTGSTTTTKDFEAFALP